MLLLLLLFALRPWLGWDDFDVARAQVALDNAMDLKNRDPQAAAVLLQEWLDACPLGNPLRLRLLDAAGDVQVSLKNHGVARRYHAAALEIRQRTSVGSAEIAIGHATVATDCMLSFDLGAALEELRKAQELSNLPPEALAVLLRQESSVHECNGDPISALHRFEHAAKLSPASGADMALKHLELLKMVVADSTRSMPPQVKSSMEARVSQLVESLIANGPWDRRDQLPRSYLPGLRAHPWHSLLVAEARPAGQHAWMPMAARETRKIYRKLAMEFDDLRVRGLLHRDTECIHDHGRGEWMRFEVNGVWQDRSDEGCATASPTACKLYNRLIGLGMPVIRAGYSAVGGSAHIKPHFGMTNGQLKWHLGLRIPEIGCAQMRVSNDTRSWVEGDILYFDDSFEHEVWNLCERERVVFQIVFVHPDLIDKAGVNVSRLRESLALAH